MKTMHLITSLCLFSSLHAGWSNAEHHSLFYKNEAIENIKWGIKLKKLVPYSAFHKCVQIGSIEMVEEYVNKLSESEKLKQINRYDDAGYTPLHYALMQGDYEIVYFLLTHGAYFYTKTHEEKHSFILVLEALKRVQDDVLKEKILLVLYMLLNRIAYEDCEAQATERIQEIGDPKLLSIWHALHQPAA